MGVWRGGKGQGNYDEALSSPKVWFAHELSEEVLHVHFLPPENFPYGAVESSWFLKE